MNEHRNFNVENNCTSFELILEAVCSFTGMASSHLVKESCTFKRLLCPLEAIDIAKTTSETICHNRPNGIKISGAFLNEGGLVS